MEKTRLLPTDVLKLLISQRLSFVSFIPVAVYWFGSLALTRFSLWVSGDRVNTKIWIVNGYHAAILLSTNDFSINCRACLALSFLISLCIGASIELNNQIFAKFGTYAIDLSESALVVIAFNRERKFIWVKYLTVCVIVCLGTSFARSVIYQIEEEINAMLLEIWFRDWVISLFGLIIMSPFNTVMIWTIRHKPATHLLKNLQICISALFATGGVVIFVWATKNPKLQIPISFAILGLSISCGRVFGNETASLMNFFGLGANIIFNQATDLSLCFIHIIAQFLILVYSDVQGLEQKVRDQRKEADLEGQEREQCVISQLGHLCEKMKYTLDSSGNSAGSIVSNTDSIFQGKIGLLTFLDDVTYFIALENGQIPLNSRYIWLKDLVNEASSLARDLMNQRGFEFVSCQISVAKVFACLDLEAFQLVLVGSTLFAFPRSIVSLEITTIDEESAPTLEVLITHSGFNISAKDVDVLFRPCLAFCRDEQNSNLTGFEMSIVKSIVNLMSGTISAAWSGHGDEGNCSIKISIPINNMKGCHSDRVVTNMEVFTTISSNLYSHDEKNEYLNSLTERIRLMNSRQMMASDQVSDSSVSFVKLDTQSNKSFRSSNLELSQSENAIDTELLSILSFPQKQVKRKLLIADKSQDFRSEFQRIVTSLTTDYEVLEASSCDEVILIMDNIDIVFIDMTMHNLPEYAELRKFQHTFVPVVGVCEALESIQKHQLDPLGLNYIITKPISKGILMSLLKTFNTSRNKPIQKTPSPSRSLYSSFFPSPRIGMETPVESMKSEFSFMSTPRIYENRSGSISPQSITLDIFYQEPSSDLNRDLIHALVVESSFPQRQTLVKTISKFTIFQDIFEASNEVDASRLCSARKFSMIFIGVHPDTTDINDIIRKCRNEGIPVITLMDINSGSCKLESSATLYRPVSSKELENAIRGILPELKVDCQDNGGTAINEEGKRKESVATLVGIHS